MHHVRKGGTWIGLGVVNNIVIGEKDIVVGISCLATSL